MGKLLLMALVLAGALPAAAQQRSDEKTPEQRCLRHEAGADAQPEYPAAEYNNNKAGRVQVALTFSAPNRGPAVRVLLHEGGEAFLEAVIAHLRGLRVPCLAADGEPVELRQDFQFAPDRRQVHWTGPIDARVEQARASLGCLVHQSGAQAPDYPARQLRENVQGRVVLRMRFERPDTPPVVESFSRRDARALANHVAQWAQGYRAPCLTAPASSLFTYVFTLSSLGQEPDGYGFRNVTFMQVLGSTVGIRKQTLALDTSQMGCPFELRVQYLRPLLPNSIGEPGEPVPARRPLIEWLEGFEFNLPAEALDAAWGDTFKVTVPCIKIDLKPTEK
jgi:hypothetical protein